MKRLFYHSTLWISCSLWNVPVCDCLVCSSPTTTQGRLEVSSDGSGQQSVNYSFPIFFLQLNFQTVRKKSFLPFLLELLFWILPVIIVSSPSMVFFFSNAGNWIVFNKTKMVILRANHNWRLWTLLSLSHTHSLYTHIHALTLLHPHTLSHFILHPHARTHSHTFLTFAHRLMSSMQP